MKLRGAASGRELKRNILMQTFNLDRNTPWFVAPALNVCRHLRTLHSAKLLWENHDFCLSVVLLTDVRVGLACASHGVSFTTVCAVC